MNTLSPLLSSRSSWYTDNLIGPYAHLCLAAPRTWGAHHLRGGSSFGHAKPTTTLQFYAHWIPTAHQSFVDVLAGPKTEDDEEGGAASGRSRCSGSARKDWWAVEDS